MPNMVCMMLMLVMHIIQILMCWSFTPHGNTVVIHSMGANVLQISGVLISYEI